MKPLNSGHLQNHIKVNVFHRCPLYKSFLINHWKIEKCCSKSHCVKSVRIRRFSGPYFPAFGLNTDQKNSEYGHFDHLLRYAAICRPHSPIVYDSFCDFVMDWMVPNWKSCRIEGGVFRYNSIILRWKFFAKKGWMPFLFSQNAPSEILGLVLNPPLLYLHIFSKIYCEQNQKFSFRSDYWHCIKSVRIWSYSGPHFCHILLHSNWIRRDTLYRFVFSPNAGKCGKNADQNNSESGHFLRSVNLHWIINEAFYLVTFAEEIHHGKKNFCAVLK